MKRYAIILFLVFIYYYCYAQDPQLTQFYSSPLYLAPSFAGATQQHRVASTYRNQWPGIKSNPFVTYTFSYDHYFVNFNSGVGLLVLRDVAGSGDYSTTNLGVQYSYDFRVTNLFHIRPGVHFLYTTKGINFSKLIWGDQISPGGYTPTIEVPERTRADDIDFSTSVLFYTEKHWFGVAVDHLLRPDYAFYGEGKRLAIKYSAFGGTQIIRRGRLLNPIDESLSIAFLFKHQYYFNTMLDLGLYWYKTPLVFGFWYRGIPFRNKNDLFGDAVAFLVGYKIDQFSIGYSYDFTISKLLTSTHGSHEIALVYEFTTTRKKRKRHMIPCPEF